MTRRTKAASLVLMVVYLVLVFQFTVMSRAMALQQIKTSLFWSYRMFFAGRIGLGIAIVGNILMFVPVGFLFSPCLHGRKRRAVPVFLAGLLCSSAIEFLQYRLMRGWMELDDIMNNSLGALLGFAAYCVVERLTPADRRRAAVVVMTGVFCIAGAGALCLNQSEPAQDDTLRTVCVQIDSVTREGDSVTLTGFAFRHGEQNRHVALELRSTATGKKIPVTTQDGLERQDVNEHFAGSIDVTRSGFRAVAKGVDPGEEYELLVHYDWPLVVPACLYLREDEIHHVPASAGPFPELEETDAAFLEKEGTLLAARADIDCWIWQYNGALYWVAGPSFAFREDGATRLQFECYTSQTERLPEERRKNGWTWETLGFFFEENELTGGDFGPYRISRSELPVSYAVSAVLTGVYLEDNWVWQQWFRPVYPLSAAQ